MPTNFKEFLHRHSCPALSRIHGFKIVSSCHQIRARGLDAGKTRRGPRIQEGRQKREEEKGGGEEPSRQLLSCFPRGARFLPRQLVSRPDIPIRNYSTYELFIQFIVMFSRRTLYLQNSAHSGVARMRRSYFRSTKSAFTFYNNILSQQSSNMEF